MFSRSYPIEEFSDISDKIDVDFPTYYKVLWKQTAFYPKRNHNPFVGRYENVEGSYITDIDDAVNRHYYLNGEALGVSDLAIEYLDSIVSLAKAKDITLIMVSNPVHEQYLNKIPDPIMQKFDALIERYSDQHLVFDKTRSPYPDTLYLNTDHLNSLEQSDLLWSSLTTSKQYRKNSKYLQRVYSFAEYENQGHTDPFLV